MLRFSKLCTAVLLSASASLAMADIIDKRRYLLGVQLWMAAVATLLASSDFCPIGAYHIEDQVLCFQGHPEFVHDYSRALLDLRQQHLGEQVYQQGVDSLKHSQQGSAVAEWMMRFVAQGKETRPERQGRLIASDILEASSQTSRP